VNAELQMGKSFDAPFSITNYACSLPHAVTTSGGRATSKDAVAAGPHHTCMHEWSSEAADPRTVSPLIVLQHGCR